MRALLIFTYTGIGSNMLLAKQEVLDKGFVAPMSFSNTGKELQDIQHTYFKTKTNMRLMDIATATLMIKCPLFVQLNLAHYLKLINVTEDKIEAYKPDVSEINTGSMSEDMRVTAYLNSTTESLIFNSLSLPEDGCDPFLAQILMPVSVYNKLIVHGALSDWVKFIKQKDLPKPILAYQSTIYDVLLAQWTNLKHLITAS